MKQLLVVLVLGMVPTVAIAQPRKPAAPGKVPTKAIPCAMEEELALLADAGEPVLCWKTGCMKLDLQAGTAASVPRPTPARPWLIASVEIKADAVCLGSTCKKLGKKLAQAIAQHRKEAAADQGSPYVEATTDLAAVVIGNAVWSVTRDRPLKLGGAKRQGGDVPSVVGVSVADRLLVADWAACAGPCTTQLVYDSSGRAKSREGVGGGRLLQLDAKSFVSVSEYATAQLYDLKTGKLRATRAFDDTEPGGVGAVRLDPDSFAVLHTIPGDAVQVTKLTVYQNKLTSGGTMYLPRCTP
jgi:hypothetical protein